MHSVVKKLSFPIIQRSHIFSTIPSRPIPTPAIRRTPKHHYDVITRRRRRGMRRHCIVSSTKICCDATCLRAASVAACVPNSRCPLVPRLEDLKCIGVRAAATILCCAISTITRAGNVVASTCAANVANSTRTCRRSASIRSCAILRWGHHRW